MADSMKQKSGDNSVNIQIGGDVNIGMTESDTVEICRSIAKQELIKITNTSDILHFRHIIFETSISEILNGSFSNDKIIENPIIFNTDVGNFMKNHLNRYREPLSVLSKGINYDDYENKYTNAKKDTFGSSNIPYTRIPNDDEMGVIWQTNLLSKYLYENDVPNDEICKIIAVDRTMGCGDGEGSSEYPLYEELYERKYYLQSLVITNTSNRHIRLGELVCSSTKYALRRISPQSTESILTLPNTPILPNQNVIIPTAIISNGFEFSNFDVIKDIKTINLGDWYDAISQVSFLDTNIEYIGEALEPINLTYCIDDKEYTAEIHKINYNSLYLINGGALCGSCPHLFFENKAGELSYGGELFSSHPNVLLSEEKSLPHDTIAIIITELEQETTYIKEIYIDNVIKTLNQHLDIGDYYRVETCQCSKVTITGSYSPKSENFKVLDFVDKYRLTQTFIKNWRNNAT